MCKLFTNAFYFPWPCVGVAGGCGASVRAPEALSSAFLSMHHMQMELWKTLQGGWYLLGERRADDAAVACSCTAAWGHVKLWGGSARRSSLQKQAQ